MSPGRWPSGPNGLRREKPFCLTPGPYNAAKLHAQFSKVCNMACYGIMRPLHLNRVVPRVHRCCFFDLYGPRRPKSFFLPPGTYNAAKCVRWHTRNIACYRQANTYKSDIGVVLIFSTTSQINFLGARAPSTPPAA